MKFPGGVYIVRSFDVESLRVQTRARLDLTGAKYRPDLTVKEYRGQETWEQYRSEVVFDDGLGSNHVGKPTRQ